MKLRDLKTSGHAPTLLCSFLHFDVSFMVWVILGALMPFIATDSQLAQSGVHFSASTKLTLVGIPLLAAGFWRVFLGLLVDQFGAKRVGVVSLTVSLAPLLIGWQGATSYGALVLVGFFLGVAGASFAVALPLASRWYPPELQGVALGIAGAGNSGTVVATVLAPMLARQYGWHAVFGFLMIPVSLTLIAFSLFAKEPNRQIVPIALSAVTTVLKARELWAFALLYFVTFGGFVGLSSFLNSFFVDQFSAPKASVGLWTWPFIVAGSLLRPVGGILADKLGGIRMLTVLYSIAACAATMIGLTIRDFYTTSLGLFVLMGSLGMGNGAVFQLVPQRFKAEIGLVTGLVGAAGGVGGYYLNFALGHLHDASGTYASGFWCFGGIALVALAVLRFVSPSWVGTWLSTGGQAHSTVVIADEIGLAEPVPAPG